MTDRQSVFRSAAFVAFSAAVAGVIVEALLLLMLHVPSAGSCSRSTGTSTGR